MPRGWRNNPQWVAIYEQRRRERDAKDVQGNMMAGMHRNRIPPQPHPFIRVVRDDNPLF